MKKPERKNSDDLEWAKNIKNEKSRICPICKSVINEYEDSFVYLKEIYHTWCGYTDFSKDSA